MAYPLFFLLALALSGVCFGLARALGYKLGFQTIFEAIAKAFAWAPVVIGLSIMWGCVVAFFWGVTAVVLHALGLLPAVGNLLSPQEWKEFFFLSVLGSYGLFYYYQQSKEKNAPSKQG